MSTISKDEVIKLISIASNLMPELGFGNEKTDEIMHELQDIITRIEEEV